MREQHEAKGRRRIEEDLVDPACRKELPGVGRARMALDHEDGDARGQGNQEQVEREGQAIAGHGRDAIQTGAQA